MIDWQLLYLNALLILLDLMRRQEELRRLEELRNQELQKRKQIQLRYFVFYCAQVWHAATVGLHEFRYVS